MSFPRPPLFVPPLPAAAVPGKTAGHHGQAAPMRPLLCFCLGREEEDGRFVHNPLSLISFPHKIPPPSLYSVLLKAPSLFHFSTRNTPLSYSFSLLAPEPLSSLQINP
jgi:hypothetical protein